MTTRDERLRKLQLNSLRKMRWTALAIILVAGAVVTEGVSSRAKHFKEVAQWTEAQATPSVSVFRPGKNASSKNLVLPGYLKAYFDAPIHARVNGYLLHWYHDIGDLVKNGEVLAVIDTPELDQELGKARADLVTAQARLDLAKVTADRWQNLLKDDAVSRQDSDVKSADYKAQLALVQAAKANVDRLLALEAFKKIVAPFDGVVTARKTDVGALISAGGTAGQALFTVSDVHQLRLYVRVPQIFLSDIHQGVEATLVVPEYPGKEFKAHFVNSANAINDNSGTVLVELMTENPGSMLKPGDYAMVTLKLQVGHPDLLVPASALIFRSEGLEVATLSTDNRVIMKKIHVAQDHGNYVLVDYGLDMNDQIIDKPMDSLAEGDSVKPEFVEEKR